MLLNANLTGIRTSEGQGVVESIDLRSLQGRSAKARGRCVVLACGGLENPRLLLAAAPEAPHGLGNEHDLVGRYFMEHPWFQVGTIFPTEPYTLVDRYYRHAVAGHVFRAGWRFSEAEQERLGVQNCCAELTIESYRQDGIEAAGELWRDLSHGSLPDDVAQRVIAVLEDIGGIAESVVRKAVRHRMVNKPPERLTLQVDLDPKPDPDSRVSLTGERDALGMPRVQLDWQLTEDDERSMAMLARRVGG